MSRAGRAVGRRGFLQGAGALLALPWLEGVAGFGGAAQAGEDRGKQRLVFLYVPNGVHVPSWTPVGTGADYKLSPLLAPLAPFKQDLLVLGGLTADGARARGDGPGDHARSVAAFLTGVHPAKRGPIRCGISVDQVASRVLGRQTRLASLELGLEPGRSAGSCDSGYACAYSNNLSWRAPQTPQGKEIRPRQVFERLFGPKLSPKLKARRLAERKSVLDAIRGDAADLGRTLPRADRGRLDEYLTGVREVERAIESGERGTPDETEGASGLRETLPRGVPRDVRRHLRLMSDLLVLALQSDSTRVITFLIGNAGSNRTYRHLGVRAGHHSLSHHGRSKRKQEQIEKINQFHVSELVYLLGRLAAIKEGERRLLDQVALTYGSGIRDGDRYDHHDLPILVAGKLGGVLKPGRHVRFAAETPLANLWLSLLHGAGVPGRRHGDSTGALKGLG
ncbi:MAG: DUF1552 domain-containing protein [Planctomycetes bacterium]|nr:DUF1552 domain-containing protein [Planctomycetota bacterium]